MKYFELFDDVSVPNRWHLGVVTLADGTEPRLISGAPLDPESDVAIPISRPGRALDFSLTSYAVPVANRSVAVAIASIAGSDLQIVPAEISGHERMVVLNVLRVVKCLDEIESEFIKWTKQDHRADLAGQYRQVTKLVLDLDAIPPDAHIFRIEGWVVGLIVSEQVRHAMERVGCVGAKFIDVGLCHSQLRNPGNGVSS